MQFLKRIMCLVFLIELVHGNRESTNRTKRALLFPASSTLGIFIAIAVPLDLPNRNVFMSYNFEANYNLPFEGAHYIPGPLKRFEEFEEERRVKRESDNYKSKNGQHRDILHGPLTKSLLSRAHIYKILEGKFQSLGYGGKCCLLRLICEVNAAALGNVNGILGDIFHIIFSPEFSKSEDLHPDYLKAEYDGKHMNCVDYLECCPYSLLDLISGPVKFVQKDIWRNN